MPKAPAERWRWYSTRTPDCAPLDLTAYPTTTQGIRNIPFPSWACRSPTGGIHIDSRLGAIDVRLGKPPRSRDEVSWTCSLGVKLMARRWLERIEDLIDSRSTFAGEVWLADTRLDDWATLHQIAAPPLWSDEITVSHCPICGSVGTTLRGRVYFAHAAASGQPLIINGNGLFVSEEEFLRRNLPALPGAFRPIRVELRPDPDDIAARIAALTPASHTAPAR